MVFTLTTKLVGAIALAGETANQPCPVFVDAETVKGNVPLVTPTMTDRLAGSAFSR